MKQAWCLFLIACTQSTEPSKAPTNFRSLPHRRVSGLAMLKKVDDTTLKSPTG